MADAMETILSDGTVLEDLATYDKTLWEKIKEWIENAIRKIKEAFEGVSPNSQAAKVLADSMDSLTELQEMFATAARKTGERTKAAPRGDAKAETSAKTKTGERTKAAPRGDAKAESSAQTKTDGNENATDTNDGRTEGEAQVDGDKMSVEDLNNRTFSYKELVAKDDLVGVIIDKNQQVPLLANGDIDSKSILKTVRNKCESIELKGGGVAYYVNVPDIGRNVRITSDGITHGFKAKRFKRQTQKDYDNARATLELPLILASAIEVNRMSGRNNINVPFSRVLIGTIGMEDSQGTVGYYAVRMIVEERTNQDPILTEMDILGNLSAVNAKKVGTTHPFGTLRGVTSVTLPSVGQNAYAYNIAHFLADVKGVFKNTFSKDVYNTLQDQRENDDFSKDLLFSIEDEDVIDAEDSDTESPDVSESPFDAAVRRMYERMEADEAAKFKSEIEENAEAEAEAEETFDEAEITDRDLLLAMAEQLGGAPAGVQSVQCSMIVYRVCNRMVYSFVV